MARALRRGAFVGVAVLRRVRSYLERRHDRGPWQVAHGGDQGGYRRGQQLIVAKDVS